MKAVIITLATLLTACTSSTTESRFEGHVIIRHSAGKIVDVYKTTQKVWCERDLQCRIGKDYNDVEVRLFGEIKHIRISDKSEWDSYVEYHSEKEMLTYEQKYAMFRK